MGSLDSGSPSMDPRYSSAFQRGGENQTSRFSSPPASDPWAFSAAQGIRETAIPGGADERDGLDERDDDESRAGAPAQPQIGGGVVAPEALRYVRVWGLVLSIGAAAALVLAALIQQSMNGLVYTNNDFQWFWAVQSVVFQAAPWLLVLGFGCLIFAGYRARAVPRRDTEERS